MYRHNLILNKWDCVYLCGKRMTFECHQGATWMQIWCVRECRSDSVYNTLDNFFFSKNSGHHTVHTLQFTFPSIKKLSVTCVYFFSVLTIILNITSYHRKNVALVKGTIPQKGNCSYLTRNACVLRNAANFVYQITQDKLWAMRHCSKQVRWNLLITTYYKIFESVYYMEGGLK